MDFQNNVISQTRGTAVGQNLQGVQSVVPLRQTDILTGCQGKLRYDFEKAQIDLAKQSSMLMSKYEYEKRMKEMKLRYEQYMALMSYAIYKDSESRLIFAITDKTGKTLSSRQLLNINNYAVKQYVSFYPKFCEVYEISWGEGRSESVRFMNSTEGILPQKFHRVLKSKGVLFLVSGRTEKKAAEALLAYSINCAEKVEIPFFFGWNQMSNGQWHFAREYELTMQEVEKDAL